MDNTDNTIIELNERIRHLEFLNANLIKKLDIAREGLAFISENGDYGATSQKTLDEINKE